MCSLLSVFPKNPITECGSVETAGCVITAGILASGFSQFKAGNKKASQFFMRARVVAQVPMCSVYA
jgi:hypothetical protein